jgi:hypothetical protein
MRRIWLARAVGIAVMLALPGFGFSYATLTFSHTGLATVSADDSNGDVHSNCHTGSKSRGAGGNDKATATTADCVPNPPNQNLGVNQPQ